MLDFAGENESEMRAEVFLRNDEKGGIGGKCENHLDG